MENVFKFRAWNHIVGRMQDFTLEDIEKLAGQIQWRNLRLMLYSSTKDIEDKLICQGDIIEVTLKNYPNSTKSYYEVLFDGNCFSLIDAKREGDKYGVFTRNFPLSHIDVYKKLGNIYQNPELVKRDK